jgi:hypothetical protein
LKSDLRKEGKRTTYIASESEAIELAQEIGDLEAFELSALIGEGVKSSFEVLIQQRKSSKAGSQS